MTFDPSLRTFWHRRQLVREVTAGSFSSTSILQVPYKKEHVKDLDYLNRLWALGRLRGLRPSGVDL